MGNLDVGTAPLTTPSRTPFDCVLVRWYNFVRRPMSGSPSWAGDLTASTASFSNAERRMSAEKLSQCKVVSGAASWK